MALQLELGGMTVEWLGRETFHLDAGAMFGPVPKLLWSGRYPVDSDNLSPFVATPLLLRTQGRNILIDTGCGNRLPAKHVRNLRVEYAVSVPTAFQEAGIESGDIDTVILTHLDWDHASGIAEQGSDGIVRLRYPNASHIIHRTEWHDANNPNARSKHTYWSHNWELLAASDRIRFVTGGEEIAPGVRVHHTGGHTRGHMVVEMIGTDQTAYHLADLLPTHAHTNPLWVTAYDNFPLDSVVQKEHWLHKARQTKAWLLLYHDAVHAAIRLDSNGEISERLERVNIP